MNIVKRADRAVIGLSCKLYFWLERNMPSEFVPSFEKFVNNLNHARI